MPIISLFCVDDCDLVFGSLGLPLMVRARLRGPWRPRLPPEEGCMAQGMCPGVFGVPAGVHCVPVSPEGLCSSSHVSTEGCALSFVSPEGLCSSSPVSTEGCTLSSVLPEGMCCSLSPVLREGLCCAPPLVCYATV